MELNDAERAEVARRLLGSVDQDDGAVAIRRARATPAASCAARVS